MKKTDSQKYVKWLRRYFKAGLFLPIFYTFVFILVITSLVVLPDFGLFKKIIGITFSMVFLIFIWLFYRYERKNEKEMKVYIDEIEVKLESQNDVDEEELSKNEISKRNEENCLSEEHLYIITKNTSIFFRYQIYLLIAFALLSLDLVLKDLLDFPTWVNVLLLSILSCLIVLSVFLGIKAYMNLKKYVEKVSNE